VPHWHGEASVTALVVVSPGACALRAWDKPHRAATELQINGLLLTLQEGGGGSDQLLDEPIAERPWLAFRDSHWAETKADVAITQRVAATATVAVGLDAELASGRIRSRSSQGRQRSSHRSAWSSHPTSTQSR